MAEAVPAYEIGRLNAASRVDLVAAAGLNRGYRQRFERHHVPLLCSPWSYTGYRGG